MHPDLNADTVGDGTRPERALTVEMIVGTNSSTRNVRQPGTRS